MAAFLALGLRRSRDIFQIGLLAGSLALSFYAQRDIWLVALAALAVIGEAITSEPAGKLADSTEKQRWTREALIGATASIGILITAAVIRIPSSQRSTSRQGWAELSRGGE